MASSSPLSIPILQDGFLPGPETFNQLANAVRRIRSNRPGLTFRLMPDGGLMLEFQDERPYVLNGALCANVLYDDSGTRYWVARGGIVRTPCWEIEIKNDRRTFGASKSHCWIEWNENGGGWRYGTKFPDQKDKDDVIVTPIAEMTSSSVLIHRHLGDIILPHVPMTLMDDYDKNKRQAFVHTKDNREIWVDVEECEVEEVE